MRPSITVEDLRGARGVLGTADDHRQLVDLARRPLRLARPVRWLLIRSYGYAVRRALRAADGVQANGYPAMTAYGRLNDETCLYLDNRSKRDTMATAFEMRACSG